MLSTHYPELIDYCRPTWRSVDDVHRFTVDKLGATVTMSGIRQALARWADAGALNVTIGQGARLNRYRAAALATDPAVVTRAIGQRQAAKVLPALLGPAPAPMAVPGPMTDASDTPHLSPERIERLIKIASDFPQDLFSATFGADGVVITFDDFHRIVALLNALTKP